MKRLICWFRGHDPMTDFYAIWCRRCGEHLEEVHE